MTWDLFLFYVNVHFVVCLHWTGKMLSTGAYVSLGYSLPPFALAIVARQGQRTSCPPDSQLKSCDRDAKAGRPAVPFPLSSRPAASAGGFVVPFASPRAAPCAFGVPRHRRRCTPAATAAPDHLARTRSPINMAGRR